MKSVYVTGPGTTSWVETPDPVCGPSDVLLAIRACGVCGSDAMYIEAGGIPPRQGATPLGHEPAAEVIEVGTQVLGLRVGDHVVVDSMALEDGLLGSGGAQGALSERVLVHDALLGRQLKVVPNHVPWEVVALNEPMAVAMHAVNRTDPPPGARVVIFGAGPIGLGAILGYRRREVGHIVVVDILGRRLEKALEVGADAVIDSTCQDVATRLVELHGDAATERVRGIRPGTDVYLDAAGAPSVPRLVTGMAKHGATFGVVAVHKRPVEIDFGAIIASELTLVWSMGYPNEIFEATDDLVKNWERYAVIVSDVLPFERAREALQLAATPGAADKVVVTMT